LSLTIVEDEYFVRMCEAVWGVSESCTATIQKSDLEHITRTIRNKMLDFSTSTQSAEFVVGEQIDPEDGLEFVYEKSAAEFRTTRC